MNSYKVFKEFNFGLFTGLTGIPVKRVQQYVGQFCATNRDGLVRITEVLELQNVKVKFINSGFEREVSMHNLRKRKCADLTVKDRTHPTTYPNTVMQSNNCGEFVVTEKTGNKCKVTFTATGYKTNAYIENAKAGKVNDPYYPRSYGVGYFGIVKSSPHKKSIHLLWRNMLKRCYSANDKRGYFGRGVTVDERWLCFANFVEDIPKLHNFDKWIEGQNDKDKQQYNLDKDFAFLGCKVYSFDNCQFLDESLNKSVTSKSLLSANKIAAFNNQGVP